MTTAEDRLTQWLRDAHAMEQQAEQILAAEADRIENYPQLKAKIGDHLQQTREQTRKLESCIKARGGNTSITKDVGAQLVGLGQAISGIFAGDEIMKGTLACYTFEHMEIASYRMLVATAEEVGDRNTAAVCSDILREEEEMAEWLSQHLGPITRQYLDREENAFAEAKH